MKNTLSIDKENGRVVKSFRSRLAAQNEAKYLTALGDTGLAPRLLGVEDNAVTMTFCAGDTLAALVETADEQSLRRLLAQLLESLAELEAAYYKKSARCIALRDFNPRNFLFDGKDFVFIDFEDAAEGEKEENYILFLAMLKNLTVSKAADMQAVYDSAVSGICQMTGADRAALVQKAKERYDYLQRRRALRKILKNAQGCVLAGGKSSRMQGRPKGLLRVGNATFCDAVIHAMQPFDDVFISANSADYDGFHVEVVRDVFSETGPIAGMYTMLQRCERDWAFFCPCDMPFITESMIFQAAAAIDDDTDAVVFTKKGRAYPALGFYHVRSREVLKNQINGMQYKLMLALEKLRYKTVEIAEEASAQNVNTAADYEKACMSARAL